MSRKRRKGTKTEKRQTPAIQWGALVGVAVLISIVLVLKVYRSGAGSAASQNEAEPVPLPAETVSSVQPPSPTAEIVALPAQPTPALLPEAQLDQLLATGEPVFIFFHSTTCVQCIEMTEIVQQVYPDFADTVGLVDVNVYDEKNGNLLQRANIRAIPTLIFVDGQGQAHGSIGVMEPDALREQLQMLSQE